MLFRKANNNDFDDLYEIWMQDHVLPFMSFHHVAKESFYPVFKSFMTDSDVYVIERNHKVIATRRIIFKPQPRAHCVELASFGVHKDYLQQGLGKRMYHFLLAVIRKEHPHVKRIELRQEVNNSIALTLAKKMGFNIEVIFPDWSSRLASDAYPQHDLPGNETQASHAQTANTYYLASRFLVKMIDEDFSANTVPCTFNFNSQIPHLKINQTPTFEASKAGIRFASIMEDNQHKKVSVFYHDRLLATCMMTQGVRTFSHIQFWELQLAHNLTQLDLQNIEIAMRVLVRTAASQCKKIEIHTPYENVVLILQKLGFQYRGKRTGSYAHEGVYFDELAFDFSFFNIADASQLLKRQLESPVQKPSACVANTAHHELITLLQAYRDSIDRAFTDNIIDDFANLFLENCAFQMTRDTLTPHTN